MIPTGTEMFIVTWGSDAVKAVYSRKEYAELPEPRPENITGVWAKDHLEAYIRASRFQHWTIKGVNHE